MVVRSSGANMKRVLVKKEMLDLYNNLEVARTMLVELKAPQSMVARVTDARLAISWLVDHRD